MQQIIHTQTKLTNGLHSGDCVCNVTQNEHKEIIMGNKAKHLTIRVTESLASRIDNLRKVSYFEE